MNATQAEDSLDVIMGSLPVNDIPAKVLFDSGASHSFMSFPFASTILALRHYLKHCKLFLRLSV